MLTSNAPWLCAAIIAIVSILPSLYESMSCDHPSKESGYPPKIFHQVLNLSFLSKFEEVMVIGDVHGCLDELQLLLQNSNSTGDNVLKILAGDMVRKGPKSVEVIRFVRNTPSVLAVRGNNDQKVLMRHFKHHHLNYHLKKGDAFIMNLTDDDLKFMEQLPYTVALPPLNAVVVHAGLRPGIPLKNNMPYDLMNVRNLIPDEHCAGGYRPHNGYKRGSPFADVWSGPVHVYFGHDHPRNLQKGTHATGLDSSCVYGRFLTGVFIYGPRKGETVTQNALRRYFSH